MYNQIHHICSELSADVIEDIKTIKSASLREINDILSYEALNWLSERPEKLVHLISELCNVDINTASHSQLILVAKTIELIYSCRSSKIVLPNHFIENLMCYCYTNCKSILNFLGSRSPGGAYTHICTWLKDQSKEPLKFPNGLVKSVFDNNQKIGKKYLISGTNTVPTSVITSNMWITLEEENEMPNDGNYSPKKWLLHKTLSQIQINDLIEKLTKPSNQFRLSRDAFLRKCLIIVQKQIKESSNDTVDEKLRKKEQLENEKVCIWCGEITQNMTHRICRVCKEKLIKRSDENEEREPEKENVDPYHSFHGFSSSSPEIKCMAGEPDFINPNDYHNVIQVLKSIGERAGVKQYGKGKESGF